MTGLVLLYINRDQKLCEHDLRIASHNWKVCRKNIPYYTLFISIFIKHCKNNNPRKRSVLHIYTYNFVLSYNPLIFIITLNS